MDTSNQHSSGPVKITMRRGPCRCGCKGRDPHHAKSFVRAIHSIAEPAEARRIEIAEDVVHVLTRVGIASMPWGAESVSEWTTMLRGRPVGAAWEKTGLR